MCFMLDGEPIDNKYLSIIINKAQSTITRFLKQASSLGYIICVYKGKKHIYFANPYIFRFKDNRMNKALALLFDGKRLKK